LAIERPRRILVIRGGAIGDFVLTLPALRALRETFPDAWIEIMGYPAIAEIARKRFYADAVSRVDAAEMAPLFTAGAPLAERQAARLKGFDVAVCFWKDEPGILAANLRRTGVREVFSINPFPPEGQTRHAAIHMLEALAPLVGRGHDPAPRVFLNEEDKAFGRCFVAETKGDARAPVLAAHPGSGGRHKIWPASHFAALMERAAADEGVRWLLLCGPADERVRDEVRKGLSHVAPTIIEELGLVQVASLLSACDGYVGNDSGITHLAAAVGAPTVAVFGPTDPAIWGPIGKNVKIVPGAPAPWPTVEQVWQRLAEIVILGA